MPADGASRASRLAGAALILASLALLAYTATRASTLSFTYDEGWTMTSVDESVWDILRFRRDDINNHPLNSILVKVARKLLGAHTYVYRLPNVAAHAVYLAASLLLLLPARALLPSLAAFALLNLNPFVLDFFSLARGYGLALALTMVALVCLKRALERPGGWWETTAAAALALATLANLAFLHALSALQAVILLLALEEAARRGEGVALGLRRVLARAGGPLVISLGLVAGLAPIMERLQAKKQFYFGGVDSFWGDTVGSLARTLLYREEGGPLAGVLTLAIAILVAALAVTAFISWRRHGLVLARSEPMVFFLLLALPALTTTALHHLLGTRFLLERTALLFVPLFAAAVLAAGREWVAGRWRGPVRAGLAALALLLAVNTARAANLRWTLSWRYVADVRDVMLLLQEEHSRSGEPARLVMSWPFKMPVYYYARQWGLDWLEVEVFEYGPEKHDYDYFYVLGKDYEFGYTFNRPFFDARRDQIIRTYPISESYLLRRDAPPGGA